MLAPIAAPQPPTIAINRTWTTPWWSARRWCWRPPVSWRSRSRRCGGAARRPVGLPIFRHWELGQAAAAGSVAACSRAAAARGSAAAAAAHARTNWFGSKLALGVPQVMRALGDYLNVKCHACVGGTSVREDTRILQAGVHVVVGTPGRVYDMLRRRALRADAIKMFVLVSAACQCAWLELRRMPPAWSGGSAAEAECVACAEQAPAAAGGRADARLPPRRRARPAGRGRRDAVPRLQGPDLRHLPAAAAQDPGACMSPGWRQQQPQPTPGSGSRRQPWSSNCPAPARRRQRPGQPRPQLRAAPAWACTSEHRLRCAKRPPSRRARPSRTRRQVGVFSATLPPEALEITRKFMNKPVRRPAAPPLAQCFNEAFLMKPASGCSIAACCGSARWLRRARGWRPGAAPAPRNDAVAHAVAARVPPSPPLLASARCAFWSSATS